MWWVALSILTYVHIRIGKHYFRHNLRVEGESDQAITVLEILFAIGWPLWWFAMFPIILLIGKK